MKKFCFLTSLVCLTLNFSVTAANADNTPAYTYDPHSQTAEVSIQADELTCKQLSELEEDEIYFMLTIMDKDGQSEFKRTPDAPEIFIFKPNVTKTDIPLWKGKVSAANPKEVYIALVEHDAALVDPDDLLGVAKLSMKVENGKLITKWDIPRSKYTPPARLIDRGKNPEFDLYGDNGHYHLSLSINKVK